MKLVEILLYIFLMLKPYYIFSSGTIQIGDIFLIFAFLLFLINSKNSKKRVTETIKSNIYYFFFLILVVMINTCYYIFYENADFLKYSMYYIFNFFVIILFSYENRNEIFWKNISNIMKFNIIIQLVLFLANIGRYYTGSRYMGTFNDPNQFGYFILVSYCILFLCNKNKNNFVYLIIAIFLILQSSSTGMMLGIGIYVILEFFEKMKKLPTLIKNYKNRIILLIIASIICIPIIYANFNSNVIKSTISKFSIVTRFEEKINKSHNTNGNLLQERGYDRLWLYPQYILFGAGEGYFARWTLAYHQLEFHATLPSILFYYGITALVLICKWIYDKIKRIDKQYYVIYFALIVESFTLLNSRQPLFWITFVIAESIHQSNRKELINETEDINNYGRI